jgi:Mg2+ and Co2+ transporter CorA
MDRILSNVRVEESPGADWIAHGILDSIVDAFFPLIRYVDGEVDDIDSLTVDPSTDPKAHVTPPPVVLQEGIELDEKGVYARPLTPPVPRAIRAWRMAKRYLTVPAIHLPRPFIYVRLFFLPASKSGTHKEYIHPDNQVMPRSAMVKHMTHMRKLVSGLSKLLGTKHTVVGLMRKRVAESGKGIDAYIGDVEGELFVSINQGNPGLKDRPHFAAPKQLAALRIHSVSLSTGLHCPFESRVSNRQGTIRPGHLGLVHRCDRYFTDAAGRQ